MPRSPLLAFWATALLLRAVPLRGSSGGDLEGLGASSQAQAQAQASSQVAASEAAVVGRAVEVRSFQQSIRAAQAAIEQLQEEGQELAAGDAWAGEEGGEEQEEEAGWRNRGIGQVSAGSVEAKQYGQVREESSSSPGPSSGLDEEAADAREELAVSSPLGPQDIQPEGVALEAEGGGTADVVAYKTKPRVPDDGRPALGSSLHAVGVPSSRESALDQCLRRGLCARTQRTSFRTFFLAATLALVVLASFKIGLSVGTTSVRLYQGVLESLKEMPKRTLQWSQTPEEILAEVYANVDPRLRGRTDKAADLQP